MDPCLVKRLREWKDSILADRIIKIPTFSVCCCRVYPKRITCSMFLKALNIPGCSIPESSTNDGSALCLGGRFEKLSLSLRSELLSNILSKLCISPEISKILTVTKRFPDYAIVQSPSQLSLLNGGCLLPNVGNEVAPVEDKGGRNRRRDDESLEHRRKRSRKLDECIRQVRRLKMSTIERYRQMTRSNSITGICRNLNSQLGGNEDLFCFGRDSDIATQSHVPSLTNNSADLGPMALTAQLWRGIALPGCNAKSDIRANSYSDSLETGSDGVTRQDSLSTLPSTISFELSKYSVSNPEIVFDSENTLPQKSGNCSGDEKSTLVDVKRVDIEEEIKNILNFLPPLEQENLDCHRDDLKETPADIRPLDFVHVRMDNGRVLTILPYVDF